MVALTPYPSENNSTTAIPNFDEATVESNKQINILSSSEMLSAKDRPEVNRTEISITMAHIRTEKNSDRGGRQLPFYYRRLLTYKNQIALVRSKRLPLVQIFQNFQVSMYNPENNFRYTQCSNDQRNRLKHVCSLKENQNFSSEKLFFHTGVTVDSKCQETLRDAY